VKICENFSLRVNFLTNFTILLENFANFSNITKVMEEKKRKKEKKKTLDKI
jgi:hypothetical protein